MTTETAPPILQLSLSGRTQHLYALFFWLFSLFFFRQPLIGLARLSFQDELASHVLLIPLIAGFLIFFERQRIFREKAYCVSLGLPVLLLAAALWFGLRTSISALSPTDGLSVLAALIVLTWIGGFILFYGINSFKAAAFPLLFLFLMSPLPGVVSRQLVTILQKGSADACYALFRLLGVPVIRHGFRFILPGVEIEVAEQCSGIHSAVSLLIAGLIVQHMLLRFFWKKACFTLFVFPIAIIKNAIRIVTITWLGMHVNPNFFHGTLHRQGGLPFSLLALALMAVLLWALRRPISLYPDIGVSPNRKEFVGRNRLRET